jgi:DNA-binding response OmpR family regulator
MSGKILVVEDDQAILTGVVDLLESEGYTVYKATDGDTGYTVYEKERPDLVLLDVMMPGKSGYDVCRQIRITDVRTPVLMLTAKGQEIDKVIGLELGADDYIVKPFGIHELLARIRAALRRVASVDNITGGKSPIIFGAVRIDPPRMSGINKGNEFELTARELHLIDLFCKHDGEVLDRDTILDKIWGVRYEGTTRTLDQHIAKLRQKIEPDPSNPVHIKTVHGMGYRFCSQPVQDGKS